MFNERAGWLGSRDVGFSNRDLGKRAEVLPHEHFSSVTGMSALPAIKLYPLLILHIISTPFNCIDTALRVNEAMIGAKVIIFVFHHVYFVSRIWRQNSSPGSLAFSHLANQAEISHMNPRRNSSRYAGHSGQPGSCEEAFSSLVCAIVNFFVICCYRSRKKNAILL